MMNKNTVKALQKRIDKHMTRFNGQDPDDVTFTIGDYDYECHFHCHDLKPYVLCRSQYLIMHVGNIIDGVFSLADFPERRSE